MPPKVDPNEVRYINIKVFGGEAGPAATLAPKLGPLGLVNIITYVERQKGRIRYC